MKKIFFIIGLLISTFLYNFVAISKAEEGACSWHGGVDCSRGMQTDGRVYCDDGFTESSTYYEFTEKCKKSSNCPFIYSDAKNLSQLIISDFFNGKVIDIEILNSNKNALQDEINKYSNIISLDTSLAEKNVDTIGKNNITLQSLYRKRKDLQKEVLNRKMSPNLGVLQGNLSYSEMNNLINYQVNALQPDIDNNAYEIAKLEEINNGLNKTFLSLLSSISCRDNHLSVLKSYSISLDKIKQKIGKKEIDIPIKENTVISTQNIPVENSNIVIDKFLSNHLKGKILLQVESKGEAWYLNPKDGKRYYMANGFEAFKIMSKLGGGIDNKALEIFKNNKNKAKKYSGRIFLQVQDKGQAFYVDFNGSLHYLKDGNAALQVMENLGLGITNEDLRKIEVGEIE